jgi:hypothetical protein
MRGSWRADAPPRAVFARLRPESIGKQALDHAMMRMCANIGRAYAEFNILDLLWAGDASP